MKYNHFDMLPERAFLKVGGKIMPQGGGGGQPTQTTVQNTSIPEYAQPYVESTLGKAAALTDITNNPYQPYKGQQVAGFTPLQMQAQQNVGNQQIAPQLADASNMAYMTGQYGLGTQGTAAQLQNASLGYGALAADTGRQYAQQATNPYAQQAYMNPYLQNALQPALQEVQRQYDITGAQEMGNATRSGAFGGSREALMAAENQRNKNMAMNQMIGQGYNTAFQQAQQAQQFGANLGLQGLQAGQQGVQGAVGAGQYGLAGLGQAGAAASTLGQLGQTQFGQEQAANQAMLTAGTQQQQLQQKGLDTAYQQYVAQLNYPYQQIGFMSDLLRGLPLTQQSTSMYQNPSMISQAAGLGTAGIGALGLYNQMNRAEGGEIKETRMADGGITKLFDVGGEIKSDLYQMEPQDLQKYITQSSSPSVKRMARQILAEKTFAAGQENAGVTQLPSNLPIMGHADGGIIAFADEGQVVDPAKEIATPPGTYYGNPSMSPEARENFSQYAQMYKDMRSDVPQQRDEAKWLALMQAGLGIAGGTSPNALANIAQGAQPALNQYATALKDIRKEDREAVKGLIDVGVSKEKFMQEIQKMQVDIGKAERVYDAHELSANATIAAANARAKSDSYKPSAGEAFAAAHVKAQRAHGDTETPDDVLYQQGFKDYLKLYGGAEGRNINAATRNEITAAQVGGNLSDRARDNVDSRLERDWKGAEAKQYRQLLQEDRKNGTNTAATYKQKLYDAEVGAIQKDMKTAATNFASPPKPEPKQKPETAPGQGTGKFIVGKTYTDGNGNTAVYKGKDKSGKEIWE
jgi:hypothetical protein